MAEVKPSAREEFVRELKQVQEIGESFYKIQKDSRADVKDKAAKSIEDRGYKFAVSQKIIDPSVKKRVGKEADELDPEEARRYAQMEQAILDASASNRIQRNLDEILKEADPKKLEGILANEDDRNAIAAAVGKEYASWGSLRQAYEVAEELHNRAKSKSLDPEQVRALREPIARAAAKEISGKFKDKGLEIQRAMYNVVYEASLRGYRDKDAEVKGAKEQFDEIKKKLTEFETKEKRTLEVMSSQE